MQRTTGSTVVTAVISVIVLVRRNRMTNEQYRRELCYRVSMAAANCMLRKGLITRQEHEAFNNVMIEKHRPMISGLFSENIC